MALPFHLTSPKLEIFSHFLTSQSFSRGFSGGFPQTATPVGRELLYARQSPQQHRPAPRAFREWREYEEAVKRKDLATALRFLKSIENEYPVEVFDGSSVAETTRSRFRELELFGPQRDWEVLDTCLNADNMKLVGSAYKFLKDRGFLPNFGKCRNIVLDGPRNITPDVLKSSTGLEVSKLAPKKWGLSGSSSAVLVAFFGGASFLVSQGIDIRPNLTAILGLAFMDSIFLGGTCLAQISSYWPPYRRRILIHEAGHLLTAYLMGCPIRGVILDPIVAMQMGIQGQASFDPRFISSDVPPKGGLAGGGWTGVAGDSDEGRTQFWDEKVANDLAEGRLDGTAFDRYCMVLFAGIAAEALVYGEAEGGENDENLFRSICLLLDPPLSVAEMSNRARWSVLQSYNLLKWHKSAHRAAVKALEGGGSLSVVIRRIEETMYSTN
ncbi:plant/F14G9-20 protein [Senna tora]|uniref:Plant/F14G9-20 protein n=1 Tax=Senna tora TaxID=362788 RepID=A0A834WI89_9FABA|nr:plant/F14G9-20 protein [Senna tora]